MEFISATSLNFYNFQLCFNKESYHFPIPGSFFGGGTPCSMWDISSLNRDWSHTPALGGRVISTRSCGNSVDLGFRTLHFYSEGTSECLSIIKQVCISKTIHVGHGCYTWPHETQTLMCWYSFYSVSSFPSVILLYYTKMPPLPSAH